ncbi:hypothetical protein D3C84_1270800 [compost metagenome]
MGIVVEPANEPVINFIRNAHVAQVHFNLVKMVLAFLVQAVQNRRRVFKMLLIDLAIKHAKRIAVHP